MKRYLVMLLAACLLLTPLVLADAVSEGEAAEAAAVPAEDELELTLQEWDDAVELVLEDDLSGLNIDLTEDALQQAHGNGAGDVPIDAAHFPDDTFRTFVKRFDTDKDDVLSNGEIGKVETIDLSFSGVESLQGIGYFYALKSLNCDNQYSLVSLDVSGCTALEKLSCFFNKITSLNVSGCTRLQYIGCGDNQLTTLDVSACKQLETLNCRNNQLNRLDASQCEQLKAIYCNGNSLTQLDVSHCEQLEYLQCDDNQLAGLDVSKCKRLGTLFCGQNKLTSLDVTHCGQLEYLDCHDNQLTSLDVAGCASLQTIRCQKNQLKKLDVRGCPCLIEAANGKWETGSDGTRIHHSGGISSGDYYSITVDASVTIITGLMDLSDATVTLSKTRYVFNAKERKPKVTVTLNGKTLKKGTDYKVSYKNCTDIGNATVKVVGINDYTGSVSVKYEIVPGTPKLTAKISEVGTLNLSVKKVVGAEGYQFCYKKLPNGTEKKVRKKLLTLEIVSVTQGKTYSVRVRAYKKVGSKYIYGDYSAAQSIRVPVYRALLIGNDAYRDGSPVLRCSVANAEALRDTLLHLGGNQFKEKNCKVRRNRKKKKMIEDIQNYLGKAENGDVSLFYYSGHGSDGSINKDEYAGLVGVDGPVLSPNTLATELKKVKGKVIVILDCCYSGRHIDLGKLNDSRFVIITSANAKQISKEGLSVDGGRHEHSAFVGFMIKGLGAASSDGASRAPGRVPADKNKDGVVTLGEMKKYIDKQVKNYKGSKLKQTVQISPSSGTVLFGTKD